MKSDCLKVCFLALILLLLLYFVYMFNAHLVEIRDTLNAIKQSIKTNPVDTCH